MNRTPTAAPIAAGLLALAAGAADAEIVGGSNITEIDPPANISQGALEDDTSVNVFFESSVLVASPSILIEHGPSGLVDDASDLVSVSYGLNTRMESYYLHFDPVGTSSTESITATVTFSSEIYGVCVGASALDATDATFSAPATNYPGNTGRQTEVSNGDSFEISADRRSITVNLTASGNTDQLRVLTAPTPALVHEYNFEGNTIDNAGGADAVDGTNPQYRDFTSAVPVPFALGRAYRVGQTATPSQVSAIPSADFTVFGTNDFTIAFSLRRFQNDTGDIDFVLDGHDSEGWDVVLPVGSTVNFRNFAGANVNFESPTLAFGAGANEWHHLAFVFDASEPDGARWYFDGSLVSADDATAMIEPVVADRDILIGGQSTGPEGLDGQLGRLRFYNFALTTEQVQAIATEGGFFVATPRPRLRRRRRR